MGFVIRDGIFFFRLFATLPCQSPLDTESWINMLHTIVLDARHKKQVVS